MPHAGGRPAKCTPQEKEELAVALDKWIKATDYPLLTAFCLDDSVAQTYDLTEDNLQDWEEFTNLRKKALKKQVKYLDEGATANRVNATFAIFKLKQPAFGWTDKQEIQHSGAVETGITDPQKRVEFDAWLKSKEQQ